MPFLNTANCNDAPCNDTHSNPIHKERGSALWFILIGVVLIGVLTAVMSRSGSSVNQSGEVEQASIKISQMLRFAKGLQSAAERMQLQGLSVSDLDFAYDTDPDENGLEHDNTNCSENSCRIFHAEGAGIGYENPPAGVSGADAWLITASNDIEGVGSTDPDLVLMLRDMNSSICSQINARLGVTPVEDAGVDFTPFTGAYTDEETLDGAARKEAGCFKFGSSSPYEEIFYHVLVAR